MSTFNITVRTATTEFSSVAFAASCSDAWDIAAADQGDAPFGITVTPAGTQ